MADLRAARASGAKVPMLTCYDFTTSRLMQEAGVPALLVGDSAANVILGHTTTLPVSLDFMIELTAAVRRGAPKCMVIGDMPFGSYQASVAQGVKNVMRMVQLSGCDCVKIESADSQIRLVRRLAGAGVAVVAHLGLRPQWIGLIGQYKTQGRTDAEAKRIVDLSSRLADAGAAAILLEAVPPEVSSAVVETVGVPVIGCGAGPACHGYVFVTHDALGLTPHRPKFVPSLDDLATPMIEAFRTYVQLVGSGKYPATEHNYEKLPEK
ncbi:MAG TPA: 3-methyl-2-oxobutanoate hydroxymethyltransferase [Tepidisphaeraceae bacterium]|nr:3-methyl-2-oxobutanoate hydroxymethyltransferase [Tepidisphaeraceae bacterium]